MPAFFAGLAGLLLLLLGARLLATVDTRKLAPILRKAGGIALLAVAALLTARGALPLPFLLPSLALRCSASPSGAGSG